MRLTLIAFVAAVATITAIVPGAVVAQKGGKVLECEKLDEQGQAMEKSGKFAQAEKLYRDSLASYKKTYGPNTKDAVGLKIRLAGVLEKQGKLADAVTVYQDKIKEIQSSGFVNQKLLYQVKQMLASTLYAQKNYKAAEGELSAALDIAQRCEAPPQLAETRLYEQLAECQARQTKYKEASATYDRLLKAMPPNAGRAADVKAVAKACGTASGAVSKSMNQQLVKLAAFKKP